MGKLLELLNKPGGNIVADFIRQSTIIHQLLPYDFNENADSNGVEKNFNYHDEETDRNESFLHIGSFADLQMLFNNPKVKALIQKIDVTFIKRTGFGSLGLNPRLTYDHMESSR